MKPSQIPRLISALLVAAILTGLPSPVLAQNDPQVYLIIAPDAFADELVPFIHLKTSQGFNVDLALLSETGTTNQDIKNFIQAYTPVPDYILLAGDTNLIPAWAISVEGSDPATCRKTSIKLKDLYYATLEGLCDIDPDIILGRFPVRDTQQLTTLIDKYLAFEAAPADALWRGKVSFIASDDEMFSSLAEDIHNKVIPKLTEPRGFMGTFTGSGASIIGGDRLYALFYHAAEPDLIGALNHGRLAVTYYGPSSATAWKWRVIDHFTATEAAALTGPPVPLVFAMAPGSADYRVETSMADTWLLHPSGGALAYIGTTFDTSFYRDHYLEEDFWTAILADPTGSISIGEALDSALKQFPRHMPDPPASQLFWEAYHILGDPSLKVIPCKCGRLASPQTTYRGKLGQTIQLPVSLTNLDILPGEYSLSIQAPAAFQAQIEPVQLQMQPGQTLPLAVSVQIPADIPNSSGDVLIVAQLGALSTHLILHVEAELQKTYLPVILHSSPLP